MKSFTRKTFAIAAAVTLFFCAESNAQFTSGRIVVLQTKGTASKGPSQATLKEFTTSGGAGITVAIDSTSGATTPFLTAGQFGGSESFLTTSTDGAFLVLGGYGTYTNVADITGTASNTVSRVVGKVSAAGAYTQMYSSSTFYSVNDIRGAVSDGTNFWAGGASTASVDGIDYFGPGTQSGLAAGATSPKEYGIRIFNNQIYYSTQKAGPNNTSSNLGICVLSNGLPTSGTQTVSAPVINTGTVTPEDFSFSTDGKTCYIAVNLNTASGGIQKWTSPNAWSSTSSDWTLAYTLGTGVTNIGAYGLVVDYSGGSGNYIIYATTNEAQTTGNRVIKITDTGSGASATNLVNSVVGISNKGITFSPGGACVPAVSISVSPSSTICTAQTATFTATPVANGGSSPSYQWKVNGSNVGSNSATYTNSSLTNNNTVYCVMTSNAACAASSPTANSNTVTMSVSGSLTPVVIITASSPNICPSTAVTFSATPTNGGSTPSYQWKVNGSNVGTNAPTYTTSALAATNSVSCVMTSSDGCASPSTATANTLTVSSNVTPHVSLASYPSNTICAGTIITLAATPVNGGSNPKYYWYINGVQDTKANKDSSLTKNTGFTIFNGDKVTCTMTSNAACALPDSVVSTNTVTLTVKGTVPVISGNLYFCPGSSTSLTVSPSYSSYLWSNGASTQSINASVGGIYSVTVFDGVTSCSITSANDTIIPNQLPLAVITYTNSCTSNGIATVTASAGIAPYSYLWSNGKTTATVTGLSAGNYTVTVTDANGCSNTPKKLIDYWNFNSFVSSYSVATSPADFGPIKADYSSAKIDTAHIYYNEVPGTSSGYSTYWDTYSVTVTDDTTAATGDNENQRFNAPAGSSLRLRNPSDSMQFLMYMPTKGYKNLILTYEVESSSLSSGISKNLFSYSLDSGATFINAGLSQDSVYVGANLTLTRVQVDLRSISGANNNSKFVFRVRFHGNSAGTSGNNRLDNITLEGDTVVSPSSVTITQFTPIISSVTNVICTIQHDGTATASANNTGTAPYTYAWNSSPVQTTTIATGLSNGNYTVTVTDHLGCAKTATTTVYGNATDINNDGITNNSDFLLLVGKFNQNWTGREDINQSGKVDNSDFLLLVGKFNQTCH